MQWSDGPWPANFFVWPVEISKPQVRFGLWNIFHKKIMITSIAEFSHSNRTSDNRNLLTLMEAGGLVP
jgi:hypothetical protein